MEQKQPTTEQMQGTTEQMKNTAERIERPLSAAEISEILPHRYPFVMIDRVIDHEPGRWATAIKCVSINEPYFTGHFPGHPVMPGVLLLEALAQTGAITTLSLPENKGKIALFGGVNKARFKRQVVPGDVVTLHCELIRQKGPVGIGSCIAKVGDAVAVKAELAFAIIDGAES